MEVSAHIAGDHICRDSRKSSENQLQFEYCATDHNTLSDTYSQRLAKDVLHHYEGQMRQESLLTNEVLSGLGHDVRAQVEVDEADALAVDVDLEVGLLQTQMHEKEPRQGTAQTRLGSDRLISIYDLPSLAHPRSCRRLQGPGGIKLRRSGNRKMHEHAQILRLTTDRFNSSTDTSQPEQSACIRTRKGTSFYADASQKLWFGKTLNVDAVSKSTLTVASQSGQE